MSRHINIPVFIPHLGCHNTCVFCNQRTISGCRSFDRSAVYSEIDSVLTTVGSDDEAEIAFFGGSFTGIDRGDMIYLLDAAKSYVDAGRVRSIRLSTRPDYINDEILSILSRYPVRHVELGIQSLSDRVLAASKRGHTAECAIAAMKAVVDGGFSLTGQMMVGLPSASLEDELLTAEGIAGCGAGSARIYPTVVLRGTELADMAAGGEYSPLSCEEAAYRSSRVLDVFDRSGVDVIRIGLCASDGLGEDVAAGEFHAAVGELAQGELFFNRICEELDRMDNISGRSLEVYCPFGAVSKTVGQRARNRLRICEKYGLRGMKVREDAELHGYKVRITVK